MSEAIIESNEAVPGEATKPQSIEALKSKMKLTGIVTRLELYGAFIDVGVGVNALIHISKLGEDRVNRVSDVLQPGDEVTVWVDKVNPQQNQLMVSMIEPLAVEWGDLKIGQSHTGTVTRIENFGAFIDIGAEREGLVHISELSHDYVKHPSEVVQVGAEVQTQILGFSKRKRRIDLSIKTLLDKPEDERVSEPTPEPEVPEYDEDDELLTAMEIAYRAALGDRGVQRRRQKDRKKQRRRQKRRSQQDDILDRTLQG